MIVGQPLVFEFWPGGATGDPARVDLLGGKGAGLAALSLAQFPTPAGFTISSECCDYIERLGDWPAVLDEQVAAALERLEARTATRYALGPSPLLLAVRSGASASMPGMMDTILNVGLHPGLIDSFPTPQEFWTSYASHLRMLLKSVAGSAAETLIRLANRATAKSERDCEAARAEALRLRDGWELCVGAPWPEDARQRLRLAINAVFRSWNNPRARAYRERLGLKDARGTAVTVQVMFPAETAGVLFTGNPQIPTKRECVIEAAWGLGDAVASGAVTPDRYVVDTQTGEIRETAPGERVDRPTMLTERQVIELSELGQRVERHFGFPCDIEWAWGRGRLVLLQVRQIKGLDIAAEIPQARRDEIERLRRLAGTERVVWVSHNLAETLADATPLTTQVLGQMLGPRGGFGRLYEMLGFEPAESEQSIIEWIAGRPYVDPRRLARLFFANLPFVYDPDLLREHRAIIEGPPSQLNWEQADPWLFARLPNVALILWRVWRMSKKLTREAAPRFDRQVAQTVDAFRHRCVAADLTTFSEDQLWAEWLVRRDYVVGELAAESLLPGYLGGLAFMRLDVRLRQIFGDAQGIALRSRLAAGLGQDIAVDQNRALEQVAQGERSREEFLERFGHRCVGEMELSRPRWREDFSYLTRRIANFQRRAEQGGASSAAKHESQVAAREAAERELPHLLAQFGAASLLEDILADLRLVQTLLPYRELGKFHWLRAYAALRSIAEEWGRRWGIGNDIYFLDETEIEEFASRREKLLAELPGRRRRWQAQRTLCFPDLIDSRDLSALSAEESAPLMAAPSGNTASNGQALTALTAKVQPPSYWDARPLSAGVVEGIALRVTDPHEVDELSEDCVLVCPSTDPAWTPLLIHARGLIVERGGALSHGAIVARDLGIPAVACEEAMRRIPSGARVRLDGTKGRVELVESLV